MLVFPPQQGSPLDLCRPQGYPRIPSILRTGVPSETKFPRDNGSEFINRVIVDWRRNPACPIPFTRSRDHRKNDNCFVEQKNGAVVREYIGYDRLEGQALRSRLAQVYRSPVPLLNFFMPAQGSFYQEAGKYVNSGIIRRINFTFTHPVHRRGRKS
jgi:hypothetical protein